MLADTQWCIHDHKSASPAMHCRISLVRHTLGRLTFLVLVMCMHIRCFSALHAQATAFAAFIQWQDGC